MWDDYLLLLLLSPLKFQKQTHAFPLPYVCLFPHKIKIKIKMQQQQHQAKTLVTHGHNTLVYYEKLDSNLFLHSYNYQIIQINK